MTDEVRLAKLLEVSRDILIANAKLRVAVSEAEEVPGSAVADSWLSDIRSALAVAPDLAQAAGKLSITVLNGVAAAGRYPEVVALEYSGSVNCSGVIVSSRWVVTAAHCVKSIPSRIVIGDKVNGARRVDVGNACVVGNTGVAVVHIADYEQDLPPTYAVIGVSKPLPSAAIIVGFGLQDVQGASGVGEKTVGVVGINSYTDVVMSTGGGKYDTCSGDSGGPCYVVQNGVMILGGITNQGVDPQNCGAGTTYFVIGAAVGKQINAYVTGSVRC